MENKASKAKTSKVVRAAKYFFEGIAWISEKAMSFLRLFAVGVLFIIIVTLVYRAIKNADVIVVKPFSVPTSFSDTNAQAGRIAANFLKQDLKRKEQQFHASIQGHLRDSNIVSDSEQQLDSGANIKLPQTGISITDVVEFISTLFGKQSISGTVFEDNNALYLHLELRGRVLSFEQPLQEGVSKLKQLESLLNKQSSKKLLSVAFENYNLYYFCNGEVSAIEQHEDNYKKWFNYCQHFRTLKDEKSILALKEQIDTSKNKKLAKQDQLIAHVLTSLKHKLQDKEDLLSRAKEKAVAMKVEAKKKAMAEAARKAKEAVKKNAMADKGRNYGALRSQALSETASIQVPITKSKATQKEFGDKLVAALSKDHWDPVDRIESEKKVADAMLLYRLKLYEDAIEKYKAAIIANHSNATAWANLGLVYLMAEELKYQDYGKARALLDKAISLEPDWGWLQHSYCITQAFSNVVYLKPQAELEKFVSTDKSCQRARSLEPSKTVLYDKLFYIAMADKLYENNKFKQAYATYQKYISIDQRADCHMYDVINKLKKLDDDKHVDGAKAYACQVLTEKAYFIEKQPSECEADLRLWQAECS